MTFDKMLEEDGVLVYRNKGVSMLPFIKEGRDVLIIKKPDRPLKKYDAVLFKRKNGAYVLHRIVKIRGGYYYILGDNCVNSEKVAPEDIIGILSRVKRGDKEIDCESKSYLFLVKLWRITYPFRIFRLKLKSLVKKIIKLFK